jgi:hypothetical protein
VDALSTALVAAAPQLGVGGTQPTSRGQLREVLGGRGNVTGNGNGTRAGRVALGSVAAIVATGLLAWNTWQDHMAEQVTQARNAQQQQICESVNAVNDTLEIIIREALVPEPGDSPAEVARDARLKQLALAEIERARCRVAPLPTRGMGPG